MHRITYYLGFTLLYITFSLLMIWLSPRRLKNLKNIFMFILVGAVLIFISSIRMNTGSDYYSYHMVYNNILRALSVVDIYEDRNNSPAFYVLCFFLKDWTNSIGWVSLLEENFIFIVVSVFTTVLTFFQIQKNSMDIKWGLCAFFLLGFYMIDNNILKQAIAMTIAFYAYDFLYDKKYVSYILCAIVAILFHVSSILAFLLYPLALFYKPSKRIITTLSVIAICISIFLPLIIPYFNTIFMFSEKYYKSFDVYSDNRVGMLYAVGSFFFYLAAFNILNRHKHLIQSVSPKTASYINLIAIGLVINALSFNFWLIIRFSLFFYQFMIFLLPNAITICCPNMQYKKKIKSTILAFAVFYILFSMDNHYFAYHTIYEDMQPMDRNDYINYYEHIR